MEEIWKQYKDTTYSVSNTGYIRNDWTHKILNPAKSRQGYVKFGLWHNGKVTTVAVHRLIAETFLEPIEGKTLVNHKDGNKSNNRLDNLEWVNQSENIQHAYATGLAKQGEACYAALLKAEDIPVIRAFIADGLTTAEIAEMYGVSAAAISHIRLGKTWKHIPGEVFENLCQKGKLKAEDIPVIRQMIHDGYKNAEIAKKYNVCSGSISGIRLGRNWKNY